MRSFSINSCLKKCIYGTTILISCISYSKAGAQTTSGKQDNSTQKKDTVKQVDIIDGIKYVFHIKKDSSKSDTAKIIPWKPLLTFVPMIGYNPDAGLQLSGTLNVSFYTGNPDNTNMSVIYSGIRYSLRNQIKIPLISEIWLKHNSWELLGDWKYFSYPTHTFGLGSNTSLSRSDYVYFSYIRLLQELLWHFGSHYCIGMGYNLDYHFNMQDKNPVTDYPDYNGTAAKTTSSGLVAQLKYDTRKNLNNPKRALFASVSYRYNSTLLGSDNDWQSVLLEIRKYFLLSPNKVLAFWSWNEFTFGGKVPYFDLPSTGWDTYANTGRGYVDGRFRAPDMVYAEAELRFGLTKNGLLGGVIFANATTIDNWPNQSTFQGIFPGEGFGLRIKFNKESDVNITIDYGFGVGGSHGLYIGVGEVF